MGLMFWLLPLLYFSWQSYYRRITCVMDITRLLQLAFAFTATEYAPLLIVTLIVCLVLHRRELFPGWSRAKYYKALGLAAALFVGTILLIWPGAWLKLTLIKNYIFMAYLALARKGEFGTQSFVQVWWQRGINSPLEYTLVVATALIAIAHLRRCPWFLPFLIYAFLMLTATFRITTSAETVYFIISAAIAHIRSNAHFSLLTNICNCIATCHCRPFNFPVLSPRLLPSNQLEWINHSLVR